VADLRTAIAKLARKLCTEKCEHAEPITASRLIPAKKNPDGIRPIGVGEVIRRIIGRCIMKVVKNDVMKAAGNLQLCAGQQAGAEAAIHAMSNIFKDDSCEAVLLVDASNAFNTLNRKAMMHNIGIICPAIARYVRNTYTVAPRLIVAEEKEVRSEEGTTQGDPIAMAIYALAISVLQQKISYKSTSVKQVGFADDLSGGGKVQDVKKWWDAVRKHGPPLGYHPNANKSCLIVKPEYEEEARKIFAGTGVRITSNGERHLGAVIGSHEFKATYTKALVNEWVKEIKELSKIAETEPHAAYTNFIHSTKSRWNYAMRTIPDLKLYLGPLEASIRQDLLPSLFKYNVKDSIRELIALPPRLGGMGIINPVEAAEDQHRNSVQLTDSLSKLIIEQDAKGEVDHSQIMIVKQEISKARDVQQKIRLAKIETGDALTKKEKKKLKMNQEKGASNWLTTLPLRDTGFSLNKQEFRDAVALRYCLPVHGIPEACVCGNEFTTDHAMICKKGGFVSLRHNEVRDITYEMMTEVCREVEQEPVLLPLSGEQLRYQTSNIQENARLDISARGFWTRGERAFFDIRVFDPTAPSYINQTLEAAHKRQENEKRRAYEERIINIEHASFTQLVFSVTGGMSTGTLKTYSRLAEMLADKRGQTRSVVTA